MLKSLLKKSWFLFSSFRKNPYQILGLNKTANEDEIKKAYLTLAKKYHPDINPTYSQKFKEINQAYHILKDPLKVPINLKKRNEYTTKPQQQQRRTYHHTYSNNPYQNESYNDPFRDQYTRNFYSQQFQNHFHFHQKMRGNYQRRKRNGYGFSYEDVNTQQSKYDQEEYRKQMRRFRYYSLPQLLLHLVFILTLIGFFGMMFSTIYTTNRIAEQRRRQMTARIANQYRSMVYDQEYQL